MSFKCRFDFFYSVRSSNINWQTIPGSWSIDGESTLSVVPVRFRNHRTFEGGWEGRRPPPPQMKKKKEKKEKKRRKEEKERKKKKKRNKERREL